MAYSFQKIEYPLYCQIMRGSYLNAHALLDLLTELGKGDKMRACQAFYDFFATSLIN